MKNKIFRRFPRIWLSLAILLIASTPAVKVYAVGPSPSIFMPLVGSNMNFGPGTISGTVINASSKVREPIANALVCASPSKCVTTGSDGTYQITGVDGGSHLLSASADAFNTDSRWMGVVAGKTTTQNFALSPMFTSGNAVLRFVLTWDPTPIWPPNGTDNDLDTHMWMTAVIPMHINTANEGDCTNYPNACLEVDYTKGFGPETIAIRKLENANYYYGVLNYYQGYPGVPFMTGTSAQVQVYNENGLLYTFKVPSSGNGDFWYVFSMVSDGNSAVFTERNCITYYSDDSPPSCP